jgi:hypothetical protein
MKDARKQLTTKTVPAGVLASELAEDEVEEQAQRRVGSRWMPRVTLALSAFILSLAVTLISAYYALQGPEVLVRPPTQVLLYRDGAGDQAILGFGLRLDMINGASAYGDVMLDAELVPAGSGVRLAFQNVTRPVFIGDAQVGTDCELGSRCIALPGLRLIENPDEMVDVPGGAARPMHLAFPAAPSNCKGTAQACARFGSFDRALAALGSRPLDLTIALRFNNDGEREVRCRAGTVDLAYLRQVGWVSMTCRDASVRGEPWL